MSLGPILGSGGLAIMIPPSGLTVLLGALGEISIGKILMAIIVPGLLLAVIYAAYVIVRCMLQPSLAPSYEVPHTPISEKLSATAKYVLPLGIIIFLVIGVVFIGTATPTEAAATGALGCFLLAAAYKKLNWQVVKKSVSSSIRLSVMILMIISGAVAFGQILAFTGASRELTAFVLSLPLTPILVLIAIMIVLMFLGMFMSIVAIMMITVPLFMPVVNALGFDPVWFAVLFMMNMEMAAISPPFGLSLFVMKGVAPKDVTMEDVFKAAIPFCYLDLFAIALVMAFPQIALWLPGLMR